MTPPIRAFALAFGLACAASGGMAQQPTTADQINADAEARSRIDNYRPDPNSFIDQPPAWRADDRRRNCIDGKQRAGVAPKVVRTLPASGSIVRPGAKVLSPTFDRPLACMANLETSHFPLPCPDGKGAVILSRDQRTATTVCTVEAGASYTMPIAGFVGVGRAKSERYDLAFSTSTEAPVTDPAEAGRLEKVGFVRR